MVFPVNEINFLVGTKGRESAEGEMLVVSDLESCELAIDNGVEEWNPMEQKGWARRLMTAKSVTVSCGGKRNYGDKGNDFLAGLALKNGNDCNTVVTIEFPDKAKLTIPCVANVSTFGGGASTDVGGLECEFLSDGKPTYVAGPSTP